MIYGHGMLVDGVMQYSIPPFSAHSLLERRRPQITLLIRLYLMSLLLIVPVTKVNTYCVSEEEAALREFTEDGAVRQIARPCIQAYK